MASLVSHWHKLTHTGTAVQARPTFASNEADSKMIASAKIELAKAVAASRIGDRSVNMKSAIKKFRHQVHTSFLQSDWNRASGNGGEGQPTQMLIKYLQHHKIPLLHFSQCPSLINRQTSTQNGTKFPLEITFPFDVKCKGSVRVFVICSALYEDLMAKQEKIGKQSGVITSDWLLNELTDNSTTGKAIEVSLGQRCRRDTNDPFAIETCPETAMLCAKTVNAMLNKIPRLPQPDGSNNGSKLRDATEGYYLVAIANVEEFGLVHAFSSPVCLITNSNQTWQVNAAVFWYDACSLQTLENEQTKTGNQPNVRRMSMAQAKSERLSTANFKKYINWWFHHLVSSEQPHLTSRPLSDDTLEFLVRKVLQLDCSQLVGHEPENCSACYEVDGKVENSPNGSVVDWSQFYGKRQTKPDETFAKWFCDSCQLIFFLESQAAKVKRANAIILAEYPEYTPPYSDNVLGLWDNGLLHILAKKQIKLKLVECYTNLVNCRVRPALLRVSESTMKGLSVVSLSDAGRIISTHPKTPAELEPVSLYLSLCESRFLTTHGVCHMYPNLDMNFMRQWIQLQPPKAPSSATGNSKKPAKKKPPYVKATALIDFGAFAKELADNGWLYGDWTAAATCLNQQQQDVAMDQQHNMQEFFSMPDDSGGSSGSSGSLSLNDGLHGNSFSQVSATGNAAGSAYIPQLDQGAPWLQQQVYHLTQSNVTVQGFGQAHAHAYNSLSNPRQGQGNFEPYEQPPNMQTYGGFEFSHNL